MSLKNRASHLLQCYRTSVDLFSSKTGFAIVIDLGISCYCCDRFVLLLLHHRAASCLLSCYHLVCCIVFGSHKHNDYPTNTRETIRQAEERTLIVIRCDEFVTVFFDC